MNASDNIRQVSDGVWRWQCKVDGEYMHRSRRITITVCAGLCLMLLAFSAMLDMETMTITATCCVVVMLIAYLVCHISSRLSSSSSMGYEMTDTYIMTGSGRWTVRFSFSDIRKIIITRNYLDLRKPSGSMLVYVPDIDFDPVLEHILSRIPETAEVIKADETGS